MQADPWSEARFLRVGVLVQGVAHLVLGFLALAMNPDFSTGAEATSVRLLGVDFNGWHSVSGILLFLPVFYAVRRVDLTLWYTAAVIAAVLGATVLFAFDATVFGLYDLPNLRDDVIYHVLSAAGFAAVLAVHLVLRRRGAQQRLATHVG